MKNFYFNLTKNLLPAWLFFFHSSLPTVCYTLIIYVRSETGEALYTRPIMWYTLPSEVTYQIIRIDLLTAVASSLSITLHHPCAFYISFRAFLGTFFSLSIRSMFKLNNFPEINDLNGSSQLVMWYLFALIEWKAKKNTNTIHNNTKKKRI